MESLTQEIPTNDKTISFGVAPVRCSCFIQSGKDNIEHIIVTEHFANHIWQLHSDIFGVNKGTNPLKNRIMRWWNMNYDNEIQKILFHALPIIINLNIWKNRCADKYGENQSSTTSVKFMIFKDISQLLNTVFPYLQWPSLWHELCSYVQQCSHVIGVKLVI